MKPSGWEISVLVAACSQVFGDRAPWIGTNGITELQNGSGRQVDGEHICKAIDVCVGHFIGSEHCRLKWQIVAAGV